MKKIDLTGQRFGRLKALRDTGEKSLNRSAIWLCECDCGNEVSVSNNSLTMGRIKSCGCLHSETSTNNVRIGHEVLNEKYRKENTDLAQLTKKISKNNTSGHKGVYWIKNKKRWAARICFKKKDIYLGSYHNKQDAINARKEAEDKYFKPILEKYNKN